MAPRLGIFLVPDASDVAGLLEVARRADAGGLDLIGIQDHPYQRRFLDMWALMATLLAVTERITVFPDVANLPLRPPAVMAKAAASLDVLSGGRFELGLGAGTFWDAVAAMGGPRRSPRESVDALVEAIEVIRLAWSGERGVRFSGSHYRLDGFQPGPPPAHRIEIWLGAVGPRMQRITGRLADGWIPSAAYFGRERLREGQRRIDSAAEAAGRSPGDVRRLLNVSGLILPPGSPAEEAGRGGFRGDASAWAAHLRAYAEDGFDGFLFWPDEDPLDQVSRWAGEVAPLVRER
jgi:alkanesulfonate monooxygenase SsuD/methylene tetrahydromethanopterin reductase-like flavin-dependent oxidoreductase (luciferase family)